MLKTPAAFPNPGSFAYMRADPRRRLRVIQRNADGSLLVSGSKDGESVTRTIAEADLIDADIFEARAAA